MDLQKKHVFSVILTCLTAVLIILTIMIIDLTEDLKDLAYKEYKNENFEPIFHVIGPRIILKDPYSLSQFEYATPLQISTMTSNHYRYTVLAEKDTVELTNDGKCLLKNSPEILSVYPTTFFLSADGDEKELEPNFLLSSFIKYGAQENTIRTPIGKIQFKIIAEDLQNSTNNRNLYVDGYLDMRVPQNINPTELCK